MWVKCCCVMLSVVSFLLVLCSWFRKCSVGLLSDCSLSEVWLILVLVSVV